MDLFQAMFQYICWSIILRGLMRSPLLLLLDFYTPPPPPPPPPPSLCQRQDILERDGGMEGWREDVADPGGLSISYLFT